MNNYSDLSLLVSNLGENAIVINNHENIEIPYDCGCPCLLQDGTNVVCERDIKTDNGFNWVVESNLLIIKNDKTIKKIKIPYLFNSHEYIYGTNSPRYYSPEFDYSTLDDHFLFALTKKEKRKINGLSLIDEVIVETTNDGDIVWEWNAIDCFNPSSITINSNNDDWIHINSVCRLGKNKWFDSGDKRFNPENLIVSSRNMDLIFIINYQTKQIVWKCYGNDLPYGFKKQHYAHIIPKGLDGEGNILLFSNGEPEDEHSYIIEFNPITKNVIYIYGKTFHSEAMSNVQKLQNGYYLIASSCDGKIIIVNKNHKIVYENKMNTLFYRVNAYPEEWFKNAHFFDERQRVISC